MPPKRHQSAVGVQALGGGSALKGTGQALAGPRSETHSKFGEWVTHSALNRGTEHLQVAMGKLHPHCGLLHSGGCDSRLHPLARATGAGKAPYSECSSISRSPRHLGANDPSAGLIHATPTQTRAAQPEAEGLGAALADFWRLPCTPLTGHFLPPMYM